MSKYPAEKIISAFCENEMIPVFYHDDIETCKQVMLTCYNAGLKIFEFTNRGTNALNNFSVLQNFATTEMPGMLLGAGTIKTEEQADAFANADAAFLVSPVVEPSVALYCSKIGIMHIPGCMTPTEIQCAVNNGAKLVKLFPGNLLGPEFVKAVKPLFPGTLFMPTGGVAIDEQNIAAWFAEGVVCAGMGSNLFTNKIIEQRNWNALHDKIIIAKKMIAKAKLKL